MERIDDIRVLRPILTHQGPKASGSGARQKVQQGSVGNFNISFGGNPQRWGHFSATMVDPSDPNTFWTMQEIPVSSTVWGTQIAAISVPESASIGLLAAGGLVLLRRRGVR